MNRLTVRGVQVFRGYLDGAQQRAVSREAELGTKDWQIKGLRDATAHITRQAEAAERGQMQTQSELDHADHTIRELNTMVQTLNQNARDANAETAARRGIIFSNSN